MVKSKVELISSKIVVELKDLKIVLEVDTTEGIKGIFIRLSNVGALSFAKIGKYHKQKYTIIGPVWKKTQKC